MTAEEITNKKQAVTDCFNELVKQREGIDAELNRLQGEFRLLEEMSDPASTDPAKTVKAEAKDGK